MKRLIAIAIAAAFATTSVIAGPHHGNPKPKPAPHGQAVTSADVLAGVAHQPKPKPHGPKVTSADTLVAVAHQPKPKPHGPRPGNSGPDHTLVG